MAFDEKLAFAERLSASLKRSRKKIDTPAELAHQFNLRYHGASVTSQAAHKWLSGTSVPRQDKIEVLAEMLRVSAQWLRYGFHEQEVMATADVKSAASRDAGKGNTPTADEMKLLSRIRAMPEHRRRLVRELIADLSLEQEMWRR